MCYSLQLNLSSLAWRGKKRLPLNLSSRNFFIINEAFETFRSPFQD
ncbi:hypothetical protein Pint_33071 [Pistacia integerrima]|uniref:Uncharacterized protein n=1 Tax=Pistacia integerrima TaxID=434235 RepID=A0ACC0XA10_9ROSI|nr:hypothetical protein Pint_33071 [Pistacia integerrima]